MEAYQLPRAAAAGLAARAEHTNSCRLVLTPKVCRDGECRNIRGKMRAADPEQRG
jgi:hypothetical protein